MPSAPHGVPLVVSELLLAGGESSMTEVGTEVFTEEKRFQLILSRI